MIKTLTYFELLSFRFYNAPQLHCSGAHMVELIRAIKELVSEVGKVGPTGVTVLALIVALSAIWVLGGKL